LFSPSFFLVHPTKTKQGGCSAARFVPHRLLLFISFSSFFCILQRRHRCSNSNTVTTVCPAFFCFSFNTSLPDYHGAPTPRTGHQHPEPCSNDPKGTQAPGTGHHRPVQGTNEPNRAPMTWTAPTMPARCTHAPGGAPSPRTVHHHPTRRTNALKGATRPLRHTSACHGAPCPLPHHGALPAFSAHHGPRPPNTGH